MFEDAHFLRETVVDVTAAVVGVSRRRWISLPESDGIDASAATLMRSHRLDLLPIDGVDRVREYFSTERWGAFDRIKRCRISHKDVLPYDTSIREAIRRFAEEKRNFLFLTNEHRVVGLMTISNLNCRQVNTYLFSLLATLEEHLASLVVSNVSEERVLSLVENSEKIMARYRADVSHGTELPIVEYLYLSDLVNLIAVTGLHEKLGYQRKAFDRAFGSLVTLRNIAAHPTKSIIEGPDSLERLWRRIDRVEAALFSLR